MAGKGRIAYAGSITTTTTDITTTKLLFNSVVSTPNGRFMTIDLKDFYLCSDLPKYECVRIPIYMIPPSIIDLSKLHNKIYSGHVYTKVRKGMYDLPQAGKLANDCLRGFLEPHGYYVPCAITPGLWKHNVSNLMFSLVVDDFGIRYTNKKDVKHLIIVLQKEYKCTIHWAGERYIGLTLHWNYAQRYVDISMPGYIAHALQRFAHPAPTRPQHSPLAWSAPVYGAHQQFAMQDSSPALDLHDFKQVQEVLGSTLLYYNSSSIVLLWTRCRLHAHFGNWQYCHTTSQRHHCYHDSHRPIAELLRYQC
jgi:hypothetical protein